MRNICEARDGTPIIDGDVGEFVLAYDTASVTVKGTVRAFPQDREVHWEIVTDDAQWPAVGFRPENVLTKNTG